MYFHGRATKHTVHNRELEYTKRDPTLVCWCTGTETSTFFLFFVDIIGTVRALYTPLRRLFCLYPEISNNLAYFHRRVRNHLIFNCTMFWMLFCNKKKFVRCFMKKPIINISIDAHIRNSAMFSIKKVYNVILKCPSQQRMYSRKCVANTLTPHTEIHKSLMN